MPMSQKWVYKYLFFPFQAPNENATAIPKIANRICGKYIETWSIYSVNLKKCLGSLSSVVLLDIINNSCITYLTIVSVVIDNSLALASIITSTSCPCRLSGP